MTKKIKLLTCGFILLFTALKSQPKIEPEELNDVAYPILNMKLSNNKQFLLLTLHGGRFLLYDISKSGGLLNKNSLLVWKKFDVQGFMYGGDITFSKDDKLISITENNIYGSSRVRVKSVDGKIIETATGNTLVDLKNINSQQILNNNKELLVCYDESIKIIQIADSKVIREVKMDDAEIACINHKNTVFAVSYDPNKRDFKKIESIGTNKKELKNAVRHKKLIDFYDFASFKKIATCNDEIDVTFKMQFTDNDEYLVLFTRNHLAEENQGVDQNNFLRIKTSDYKLDNVNFIYKTSEINSNFDVNTEYNYFIANDNHGFFLWKKKVEIYDFNELNKKLASFMFQGRPKRKNIFAVSFALSSSNHMIVSNGSKVLNWNFIQTPNYIDYIDRPDHETLADSAAVLLQKDLDNPESSLMKVIAKKQIHGLYIFDITIMKNGEVTGIYASSDDKTNISMQNTLKDILMKYDFDIKIPKNERVKFKHMFNL